MDWSKFAWLNRGGRRKKILLLLNDADRPLTTKEIKDNAKIAISQASVTISELYNQDMLSCKNPQDKIGKLYEISKFGKEMLQPLTISPNRVK